MKEQGKLLIRTRPTRNAWLKSIYEQDLVRADEFSCMLADKLFFARMLKQNLGERSLRYYPKTRGLFELSGGSVPAAPDFRQRLAQEFPGGFIVKPAAEVNSAGETLGFYFDPESFFADIKKLKSEPFALNERLRVLHSAFTNNQWVSPDLGRLASGERLIVQSDVGAELIGEVSGRSRRFDEVRTHTFEEACIDGGDYHRWSVSPVQVREKFRWAQEFTRRFLAELPREVIQGQAWSLDLMVAGPNAIRIIDVNTNRGKKGHWSGFLVRPDLLGAYTRHLERTKGVKFAGWNGLLLRRGWASYHKYLKKKYIEGIS